MRAGIIMDRETLPQFAPEIAGRFDPSKIRRLGDYCHILPLNRPNQSRKVYSEKTVSLLAAVWKSARSRAMIVSALFATLCACSPSRTAHNRDETHSLSPRVVRVGDPVPKGGGVYKLGDPYLAGGKWYVPVADRSYDKVGLASWYGDFFHGRKTANGEIYDMNALTAAHPTLPMPAYAKVTSLTNNRSIVVRINDRGPYASDRIIDLSHRAAELLGFHERGTAAVRVQYYGAAPLDGNDSLERKMLTRQPWAASVVSNAEPAKAASANLIASAVSKTAPSSLQVRSEIYQSQGAQSYGGWTATSQSPAYSAASFTSR